MSAPEASDLIVTMNVDACAICRFRTPSGAYIARVVRTVPGPPRIGLVCLPCARSIHDAVIPALFRRE